ncbi:MAG TPA: SUMF1/EgtB/PvdO family nonheme iron enzyme [Ktedonobacterales bacterium]|nr:SUMF1/EgtB/PvdO family nonheme iron enzyme [Ktedonobacterales bacterium]
MPESASSAPPDQFPLRLAALGYHVALLNGAEVLLPPLSPVPAGPFFIGSDPSKDPGAHVSEIPQHTLELGAFQIATYPITVAEYACFVRAGQKEPYSWRRQLRRLDHPVVYISWRTATAYANWLTERTGQPWRVPSEAEWEKAARGADGRMYPWGDQFDASRANTSEGKPKGTTPVGSYLSGASPYGALDMVGNCWEWTNSVFHPYPYLPHDARAQEQLAAHRVLRGGSWGLDAWHARAAFRFDFDPFTVNYRFGFRLVLAGRPSADPPSASFTS